MGVLDTVIVLILLLPHFHGISAADANSHTGTFVDAFTSLIAVRSMCPVATFNLESEVIQVKPAFAKVLKKLFSSMSYMANPLLGHKACCSSNAFCCLLFK